LQYLFHVVLCFGVHRRFYFFAFIAGIADAWVPRSLAPYLSGYPRPSREEGKLTAVQLSVNKALMIPSFCMERCNPVKKGRRLRYIVKTGKETTGYAFSQIACFFKLGKLIFLQLMKGVDRYLPTSRPCVPWINTKNYFKLGPRITLLPNMR